MAVDKVFNVESDSDSATVAKLNTNNESLGLAAQVSPPLPIHSVIHSPMPHKDKNPISKPPPILGSDERALERLVNSDTPRDELLPLVETVVLNVEGADIVGRLQGTSAQTFVDVLDQACMSPVHSRGTDSLLIPLRQALDGSSFSLGIRNKCVRSLYKMCAGHKILPTSMRLELPEDAMVDIQCWGGYGIVSKSEYRGREVAVKALRPRRLGSEEMSKRFWKEVIAWKAVQHPNILPLLGVVIAGDRIAMVSEWMAGGNIKEFIGTHPNANRYELLADATKGLIYIHRQGMIHRDLKGANILVDRNGRACLADFGLLTIEPDSVDITPSNSFQGGGTIRWMGPELLCPERLGLTGRPLTKSSDCYALGMVVYEVLSGKVPFHHCKHYRGISAIFKILRGDRPGRPQGAGGLWFTGDIWTTLECCWKLTLDDRPSAEDVLHCLEKASVFWTPAQTMAFSLTTDQPTSNPDSCTGESTNEDEISSACQTASIYRQQSRPAAAVLEWAFKGAARSPQPPSAFADDAEGALRRLVWSAVSQEELPFLIELVVSNLDAANIVQFLQGSDAQTFVDVIDQALHSLNFPLRIRKKCVELLCKMCTGHTLLPRSLHFELPDIGIGGPAAWGVFAEIFKCDYRGQWVAVKILRVSPASLSPRIMNTFHHEVVNWKVLPRHPNVLPLLGADVTGSRLAMVSQWMANGEIRDFITAHPNANRFKLLADVARGLVHLHNHGVAHGDLRGRNVLVDGNGRARLIDFVLLRDISDTTVIVSSNSSRRGFTARWAAPELFLDDSCKSKSSDCYSLGMVAYETLTNRVPFYDCASNMFIFRVLNGERPKRPQGTQGIWFTDDIWNILEDCWRHNPSDRPSAEDVLYCFEVSQCRNPPSQVVVHPPMSNRSDGERTDEGEVSSLSQIAVAPLSFGLSLEDLNAQDFQALGTSVNDLSGSEESLQGLDGASPDNSLLQEVPLGRRGIHEYLLEGPPQYRLVPSGRQTVGIGPPELNGASGEFSKEENVVKRKNRWSSGTLDHLQMRSKLAVEWVNRKMLGK
ncbi:kinase-like domain-containing protein [Thelephora terrestris]|uniref:Kinase-like domain-containing protein n=1 Tax=Thelephora terrestris TaxID=56493 RepID=A0A9P6H7J6_9AGAM|nr:kinase-like domain-containing protein [Thelephora terrestris]